MQPWEIALVAVAVGVGYAVGARPRSAHRRAPVRPPSAAPAAAASAASAPQDGAPPAVDGGLRRRLLELMREVMPLHDVISHPDDLMMAAGYREAVDLLAGDRLALADVYGYLVGDNWALACAAAAALERRPELVGAEAALVGRLDGISIYARSLLLRTIGRGAGPDAAFRVLLAADGSWGTAMGKDLLRGFLGAHLDAAHVREPAQRQRLAACEEAQVAWLLDLLAPVETDAVAAVREALQDRSAAGVDLAALRGFATVLEADPRGPAPLPSPTQDAAFAELVRALHREPPRSLWLIGPAGVGKATVVARLAAALVADGWTVFVAGAAQLLAGQSFVGQLEQRVLELLRAVGKRRRVLWLAPDFAEFATAGRTLHSATGLLDILLPHLLAGDVRILAPLPPAAAELLFRRAPMLRSAAISVRLGEASTEETLEMARAWLARNERGGVRVCDDRLLHELHQRAQQHVVDQARPGGLLSLLGQLKEQIDAPGAPPRAATIDDVIALLSQKTGLPPAVLDERDGLDLDGVRRAFAARVMGQPDAVDCLVERIAMLKAGLCDPRRPIGVFLFTGPTGTGKTELCRALAAYLFGSEQRLLRLDMSEFQTVDATLRITGDADDVHGRRALVHEVRERPFAVVLLDEIEKAHPLVFDLFLQVFDEGRLTDRLGRVADFRHTIVIMTSNLGVKSLEGAGLGFGGGEPDLQRALEEVFRREFLNRIDRVVVFRALEPATLRDVLKKELDQVLQRRGLRSRPWAVEWDESALEFLLAQGWSPALGARPLRRAIERHVLAPLARAIVTDRAPAGDQFLFVRSDGRGVQVEFVDPDAPPPAPPAAAVAASASLRTLAREGQGRPEEVLAVERELQELGARVGEEAWTARKAAAYAAMGAPAFWTSADRHAVLGLAELKSRIETALQKATERVGELVAAGGPVAADTLRALAMRTRLLQVAITAVEHDLPQDAYLTVATVLDPNGDEAAGRAFAAELVAMYAAWAQRRGMQWQLLDGAGGGAGSGAVVAVTGFGAYPILAAENGLHVLDPGDSGRRPCRVRVTAVPQPPTPASGATELELARASLQPALSATPGVVRRYRRAPSPEVRDRVRGWRTGRLDRVLAGEFDVME